MTPTHAYPLSPRSTRTTLLRGTDKRFASPCRATNDDATRRIEPFLPPDKLNESDRRGPTVNRSYDIGAALYARRAFSLVRTSRVYVITLPVLFFLSHPCLLDRDDCCVLSRKLLFLRLKIVRTVRRDLRCGRDRQTDFRIRFMITGPRSTVHGAAVLRSCRGGGVNQSG